MDLRDGGHMVFTEVSHLGFLMLGSLKWVGNFGEPGWVWLYRGSLTSWLDRKEVLLDMSQSWSPAPRRQNGSQ